jgi:radical SAM protein with 4Fe4S-binding SPASM domain
VQITLGSSRAAVHNALTGAAAFDQTVQGIRNAVASNVHTITNTTILRSNADHLDELIKFLHQLGIRTFALNSVIAAGGGVDTPEALTLRELAPLLVRVREMAADYEMRFLWYTPTEYCRLSPLELDIGMLRCNAGEYTLCIEPNGEVLPCQSYYVSVGNILRDSWEHIWDSELFQRFRQRTSDPQTAGLPTKCWECDDLPVCGGGCPLDRKG